LLPLKLLRVSLTGIGKFPGDADFTLFFPSLPSKQRNRTP
jgi:hypothetical protein